MIFSRNRELNDKHMADGRADEAAGHAGASARIAAWRAYGHAMLSETVVVHNIKSTAEYVAISAYYERYRVELAKAARAGEGSTAAAAGAAGTGTERWTVRLRPLSEADDALNAMKRMRGQIT